MPARSTRRKSPKRAPLTREAVFQAALAYVDTHGVDALSMRSLASEMGYGAMSLYNHVANKDEILVGMVELVADEFELPASPSDDWKADLRALSRSAHRTLLRHRWAAPRWSDSPPGPARLRYNEAILRILREAGCSVGTACAGFHAITTHVLGYTLQRLDFPVATRDLASVARDFLGDLPTEEFPFFAEHVQHHIDEPIPEDGFGFVLDLILDELERARSASEEAPAS